MAGFGGSIKLTGESEYRNALRNIKQSLQEVSSELRLTASQYDKSDNSMATLKSKSEALSSTLKQQEKAINEAGNAYNQYSEKVNKQREAHEKLTKEYDEAKAKLEQIKTESGETSQSYQEQASKVTKLSSEVNKSSEALSKNESSLSKLKTQLNNAEATYNSTKSAIENVNNEMQKLSQESNKSVSGVEKLTSTIDKQENELGQLKEKYSSLVLEQGKSSSEARQTAGQIKVLSNSLNENKAKLENAKNSADKFDDSLDSLEKTSNSLKGGFTVVKGAIANLVSNGIQNAIGAVQGLAGEALSSADALKKFESTMGFAGFDNSTIQKAKKEMKEYADQTVYDLDTISNTTAQLASNGIKDFTGLTEASGNLNAVAGGNADTFRSVAMVLTQTAGAGKLTTENWNQLADAIPGASGKLQEQMKKNGAYTGNFRDAMAKGQITADEFNKAIMQLGNKPVAVEASRSVSTFEGAMGNLQATVVDGIMQIIDTIGMENITGFINKVNSAITKVIPIIKDIINFILEHKDAVIAGITGITTAFMAWKAFTFISSIVSTVQLLFATVQAGVPIMEALNIVLNANPIGIFITVIAGVVTALIVLWNKSDAFRNFCKGLWQDIKKFVGSAVEGIVGFFTKDIPHAIDKMIEFFKKLPTNISNFLGQVITNVTTWASKMASKALDAGKKFLDNVVKNITQLPNKVATFLSNVISKVTSWASKMASKALDAGKKFVSNVIKNVTNLPSKVGTHLKSVITKVVGWASQMASNALSAGKKFVSNVINAITNLPSKVSGLLSRVISSLATWASNMASKGAEGARRLVTATVNGVKSLPSKMLSIGGQIVTGLWNGIGDKVGWITSKIKGFGDAVMNSMKKIFNIHSPSRRMRDEVGAMLAKGVVEGVQKEQANTLKEITKSSNDTLQKYYKKRNELQNKLEKESSSKQRSTIKKQLNETNEQIEKAQGKHNDKIKKQNDKFSSELVSSAKSRLSELKKANEINEAQEITYWQTIVNTCDKGTKAYKTASALLQQAKNDLKDDVSSLNKKYNEDTANINKELKENINELKKTYNEAVSQRKESIMGFVGLFDEYKENDTQNKETLVNNLSGQVGALSEWDNTMTSLEKRLGGNTDLLKELDSQGLSSLGNLKALNSMTDAELANYVSIWNQKEAIAKDRAVKENASLKEQTDAQVKELKAKAKSQIDELKKTYEKNLKKLGVGMKNPAKSIGTQIMAGIKEGLKKGSSDLSKELKNQCKKLVKQAKKDLKIHSPSQVFRDEIGVMISKGIGVGMVNEMSNTERSMKDSLNGAVNNMRSLNNIPMNFDTSRSINDSLRSSERNNSLVSDLQEAMSNMEIKLDDEKVGKFVKKTVSDAIYT